MTIARIAGGAKKKLVDASFATGSCEKKKKKSPEYELRVHVFKRVMIISNGMRGGRACSF